jgi:hypothetical protein
LKEPYTKKEFFVESALLKKSIPYFLNIYIIKSRTIEQALWQKGLAFLASSFKFK